MSYVIWSHVRYRIDSWKFLVGTAKRAQDGTMKTWRQNVVRFGIDTYEVRPREDHHGVDLISDMLPFHRLLYPPSHLCGTRRKPRYRRMVTLCWNSSR